LAAPDYAQDEARQRPCAAARLVLRTLEHPRMQVDFIGTYDVRGWGHIYALELLLQLQQRELVPAPLAAAVATRTEWLVQALVDSAIPERGGWNYSRPAGYSSPQNAASTFMTAPALQACSAPRSQNPRSSSRLDARSCPHCPAVTPGRAGQQPARRRRTATAVHGQTPSSAARATACELLLLLAERGDRPGSNAPSTASSPTGTSSRAQTRRHHVRPPGIAPHTPHGLYCARSRLLADGPGRRRNATAARGAGEIADTDGS
jgi:hypothetical protein